MAQRVFGPVRGAGVQVTELEGDKTIEPAALGFAGYGGVLEKGDPGKLLTNLSKTSFLKRCGSYIDDSQVPDASIDYYDGAAGAGGIFHIRVTDGNELQAEFPLYARKSGVLTKMGTLKAKNGGRWGGKKDNHRGAVAAMGDFAEAQVTTGIATWKTDQWKGGWLEHPDVPNKRYQIIGNTAAGVVNLAADSTLDTDIGAGTNQTYYMYLENEDKALSILIADGEEKPSEEFQIRVYVDGVLVNTYPNLSVDPSSQNYWEAIINDDGANDEIEAEDLWTGAYTADVRPANHYGVIDTVTATVLTAIIHDFTINSPGGGDPTFGLGTTTDDHLAQKITITMTSPTAGDAVSDKFGALGTVTLGTLFDPPNAAGGANENKWVPPFTMTAGGSPLVATDTLVINYKPFLADSLINGLIYPDKANASRTFFRIVDNDHKSITAADGSDMTADGAPADEFLAIGQIEMSGGRDGNADLADANYNQQAWDTDSSPFNQLRGKNVGLVKFATPGITATAVQKGGLAYADAKNHQYRYEIPSATVTEEGADAYINDTLGRSNYAVVTFPSYGYMADPLGGGSGKLKLATLTGQIHGAEAAVAKDWNGYHKAAAGEEVTLPKILKLTTGDKVLNEEYLNPLGINVCKKVKGNFILWGDRTLWLDSTWKWKHQREQMSYYEHVLMENFGWIVFAINDTASQTRALTSLNDYFLKEYNKGALRGDTYEIAASIKIDAENNTNATAADGDLFADILLRLADTIERFRIRIGKQGIFEAAA